MTFPHRSLALCASAVLTLFAVPTSASASACAWGCSYTQTRYPIVLAHGAFGFQKAFGLIDYWYGAVEALERGGAQVFVSQVTPFNASEERGEELLAQIEDILAITGAPKANLIAHAQGGFDARYVATVAPQLLASVTTIGAPHTGSAPFDFLHDMVGPPSETKPFMIDLTDQVAAAAYLLIAGDVQGIDIRHSAQSLSYEGAAQFNQTYSIGLPESPCGQGPASANGIQLYSWSGTSLLTNPLDPTDALFVLLAMLDPGAQTEGFTERCSSHFGRVIRDDYPLNHLDAIDHIFGLRSPFAPDPLTLLRSHANRLKLSGM